MTFGDFLNDISFPTARVPDTHQIQNSVRQIFMNLVDELARKFPWIGACVNKIDVTNIGRQHDLTELLNLTDDIEIDTSMLFAEDSTLGIEKGR